MIFFISLMFLSVITTLIFGMIALKTLNRKYVAIMWICNIIYWALYSFAGIF